MFRGNGRPAIFKDDRDRERLLGRLAKSAATSQVDIYLYCLMHNHVHLEDVVLRPVRHFQSPEAVWEKSEPESKPLARGAFLEVLTDRPRTR